MPRTRFLSLELTYTFSCSITQPRGRKEKNCCSIRSTTLRAPRTALRSSCIVVESFVQHPARDRARDRVPDLLPPRELAVGHLCAGLVGVVILNWGSMTSTNVVLVLHRLSVPHNVAAENAHVVVRPPCTAFAGRRDAVRLVRHEIFTLH